MSVGAKTRIVVVGGGKMGEAMVAGWVAAAEGVARPLSGANFTVVEPTAARRDFLVERYGVTCVESVAELSGVDVVVLAVKPQVMMAVLAQLTENTAFVDGARNALFVSIAAGLPTARIEAALPSAARLVRCMPNTPLMVGKGATAVCAGACATAEDVETVRLLFACLGVAHVVDEADIDAVCGVSGSGPAYVAAFVEALRDAGVAQGLAPGVAEELALQTVLGTASLIKETAQAPEAVREAVCSPGGTTLAALDAMNAAGFANVIDAGVAAAVRRSKELGSC